MDVCESCRHDANALFAYLWSVDGSHRETLHSDGVGWPNGLTLDLTRDRYSHIYFLLLFSFLLEMKDSNISLIFTLDCTGLMPRCTPSPPQTLMALTPGLFSTPAGWCHCC